MLSSVALLALASGAMALKVTEPSDSTIWSTGEKQTIKWDTVSSDESTFNIYLSNKASYPPTDVLLASDVSSSDGSYDVDGSKLTDGNSYTINFTNGTKTEQIYAQSSQFNITEGTSSGSSSSSSSASATASGSSTASASSTGADSTGTASSTSSGSASATATATKSSSTSDASSTSASSSGSASASGSATGSSSSTSATASAGATSGAGKIVASWFGMAAVAALAL
ncbi:extracellular conserved serine-rich protein [Diaporthe amygdali]|uniref:extracellular conserved serine-rich protein n=1 Tax=Phomopsis amygdali TaxID=1214568 RepID=UPI0022FEA463|nr:extracellular conserved serine-rich protein [Diaporthe amygdali]KAJ0122563.1 extracellular conserved serine-rich protein [Diaporthe amygdali]